jgi:hypothetical protein
MTSVVVNPGGMSQIVRCPSPAYLPITWGIVGLTFRIFLENSVIQPPTGTLGWGWAFQVRNEAQVPFQVSLRVYCAPA